MPRAGFRLAPSGLRLLQQLQEFIASELGLLEDVLHVASCLLGGKSPECTATVVRRDGSLWWTR